MYEYALYVRGIATLRATAFDLRSLENYVCVTAVMYYYTTALFISKFAVMVELIKDETGKVSDKYRS